jgi:hypothetical protein
VERAYQGSVGVGQVDAAEEFFGTVQGPEDFRHDQNRHRRRPIREIRVSLKSTSPHEPELEKLYLNIRPSLRDRIIRSELIILTKYNAQDIRQRDIKSHLRLQSNLLKNTRIIIRDIR